MLKKFTILVIPEGTHSVKRFSFHGLILPLVLVAAVGLGLFFAFAASQMRPTFASGEDLRKSTGLPLLGVVTILTTDDDRHRDRVSLFRFVAASGGLVGLFAAGLITMTLVSRFGG